MNKKVDQRRKRKPEKKHKGESRYLESTNGFPFVLSLFCQGAKSENKKGRATGGIRGLKKSYKKREKN
jgi:hypothetical protein